MLKEAVVVGKRTEKNTKQPQLGERKKTAVVRKNCKKKRRKKRKRAS